MKENIQLFWMRRDLRIEDNVGLYYALAEQKNVQILFIFDPFIINKLDDKADARVTFIYDESKKIKESLININADLWVKYDAVLNVFQQIQKDYNITHIYNNEDYEPYAISRDESVKEWCNQNGIIFKSYKDQVIFAKNEIIKSDGKPYTVYTPYAKAWLKKIETNNEFHTYDASIYKHNLRKIKKPEAMISIADIGFEASSIKVPHCEIDDTILHHYAERRDFPAYESGTSRLGIHLRFGTISIRYLVKKAALHSSVFLKELIWREFFMMITYHFPYTQHSSFKPKYDFIEWRNDENEFKLWCEGRTGYPMVDAGMRQLNTTGFMHNRVRMICASFLVKHLLIDWRWGEAYFATKLLDYDLSANVGNWQWAAGCGCDAAPYFRIFNPSIQLEKFDKEKKYIRKWIPEYESSTYPQPIVVHEYARERCLATFQKALKE